MIYAVHGVLLDSETEFPELRPRSSCDGSEAAISYQESLDTGRQSGSPEPFLSCDMPDGNPFLTIARIGDRFLARFTDRADFLVSADGDTIRCIHGPAGSPETIRHLLLDHILPLVLNLRGKEVLHASGAVVHGRAALFAGPSGSGKSTLAAALVRTGCPLLSDDSTVLQESAGRFEAVPAYAGFRLWEDAAGWMVGKDKSLPFVADYSPKRRWTPEEGQLLLSEAAVPVGKIWFVNHDDYGEAPRSDPMTPAETLAELLSRSFRMDVTDPAMLKRQFRFLAEVAEMVPAARLTLAGLPEGPEAVAELVKSEFSRL